MTETPTSPSVDGETQDESAYQLFKFMEWRGVIKTRDDFVRKKWAELPDENGVGPCNVDCNCDHTFYGKNYYREFSAALTRPAPSSPALDPGTVEECAKVADHYSTICLMTTTAEKHEYGSWAIGEVAKAIRALIGQPAPTGDSK